MEKRMWRRKGSEMLGMCGDVLFHKRKPLRWLEEGCHRWIGS